MLRLFANATPLGASQPVQTWRSIVGAYVAAEPVRLVDGHVQFAAALVLNQEVLAFDRVHLQRCQTAKDTDSVLDVHHIVSRRHIGEKGLRGHLPRASAPRTRACPSEYLGICQQLPLSGRQSQTPTFRESSLDKSQLTFRQFRQARQREQKAVFSLLCP